MWSMIRLYVPAKSLIPAAALVSELSLRNHAIHLSDGSGALIYVLQPHSPTDRKRFAQLEGVVILPHPFHPQVKAKDFAHLFPFQGDIQDHHTSFDLWKKIHEITDHPALHPEA